MNDRDDNETDGVTATPGPSPHDTSDDNGDGTRKGNGDRNGEASHDDAIGEPEYFLIPLLASDPVPYLFDGDGNLVDAEGNPVSENGNGSDLPLGIRRLQAEALAPAPSKTSDP